jgi:hypothetical protein
MKEVDEAVWLVSFTHYDPGHVDLEPRTFQPLDNRFGPGLSPMFLGTVRFPCLGVGHTKSIAGGGIRTVNATLAKTDNRPERSLAVEEVGEHRSLPEVLGPTVFDSRFGGPAFRGDSICRSAAPGTIMDLPQVSYEVAS